MTAPLISALAASKLPRPVLLLMVLLYAVPGLFGRDPWRSQDMVGFGIAYSLAQGPWSEFALPHMFGQPFAEEGPLMPWLSALAIKTLPMLPADEAARIAPLLIVLLAFAALWYAAFRFALDPQSRPADPLGAGPAPLDWARTFADCCLLLLIACLGLVKTAHETTAEISLVLAASLSLMGAAWATHRPWIGGAISGLAVTCALLGRGYGSMLAVLVGHGLLALLSRPHRWVASRWLTGMLLTAGLFCLPWLLVAALSQPAWWQAWLTWNSGEFGLLPQGNALEVALRTLPWSAWPAWPLALWGLYGLRDKLASQAAVIAPLVLLLSFVLLGISSRHPTEDQWVAALPAMALLGATGLTRVRRSITSLVDWFAVIVYTTICAVIWLYWTAYASGSPAKLAARIQTLFPQLNAEFQNLDIVFGISVTVAWFWLIFWRIRRGQPRLWRPVILSAAGLTLTWALLTTLWLPAGDAARSYRPLALRLHDAIDRQGGGCVMAWNLDNGPRAAFGYFVGLQFQPVAQASQCPLLLIQDSPMFNRLTEPPAGWALAWEGRQNNDRRQRERFRLYRKPDANLAQLTLPVDVIDAQE